MPERYEMKFHVALRYTSLLAFTFTFTTTIAKRLKANRPIRVSCL